MSEWRAKRFWTDVNVVPTEGGHEIRLDSRKVMTPTKAPLVLPTEPLAQAIAAEWAAQDGVIDPLSMPMTRSANSAIDKVRPRVAELVDVIASYGETDLLCHRADAPEELIRIQADAWDPLLDWARADLGAPLVVTTGVLPVDQPVQSLERLKSRVAAHDHFALTALDDLVALSGSLIIGLAALQETLPVDELWRRSRIDETWQESQWGVDSEAASVAARKRNDFLHAAAFFRMSRAPE